MKEFMPSVTLKLCEWQLIDVALAFFMVLPMWRTLGAPVVTKHVPCHPSFHVNMAFTWTLPFYNNISVFPPFSLQDHCLD